MDIKQIKLEIIKAGNLAVLQLIKVAKEDIIKYDKDDELAPDRLKICRIKIKIKYISSVKI